MITDEIVRLLKCPENRSSLTRGEQELVRKLNEAIARRELKNSAGRVVEAPLDGVLVREDRAVAYPIVDEIPLMLIDESIPLTQLT